MYLKGRFSILASHFLIVHACTMHSDIFFCFGRLGEDFQNIEWPKTSAQLTTELSGHTPLGNKCIVLFHAF
jgi:hypothetical protein